MNVLCAEGGGANGLRQVIVLEALEREMGVPLLTKIDFMVGTSTGACTVALLNAEILARNCVDFYKRELPNIFKGANRLSGYIGAKYKNEGLREALEKYVPIKMRAAGVSTMFLTREGQDSRSNVYIKSWDPYWLDFPMAWGALASSCAQTYFNGFSVRWQGKEHRYQDGGLIENNPVISAYRETVKFRTTERLVCVNPGCGRPFQAKFRPSPNGGILTWGAEIYQEMADAQSEASEQFAPVVFDEYHRLNPERRVEMEMDCADFKTLSLVEKDTRAWVIENKKLIVAAAAAIMQ